MAVCEKCKSSNVIESENGHYCCNCSWESVKKDYVKKQTNADKIRAMSDEELAEYICKISMCNPRYCPAYDVCMGSVNGNMKKWLQTEAE